MYGIAAGVTIIGGGAIYTMVKDSDPLRPFFEATQKVFTTRLGDDLSDKLIMETKQAYEVMADHPKWFLRIMGRFKYGRETFAHPLREGWPPKFLDDDAVLS